MKSAACAAGLVLAFVSRISRLHAYYIGRTAKSQRFWRESTFFIDFENHRNPFYKFSTSSGGKIRKNPGLALFFPAFSCYNRGRNKGGGYMVVEEEPGGPAGHHRDHRPGGRGRAAGGHGGVRAPHRPRGHRPGQAGKGGEKLRLRPPGGAPLPPPPAGWSRTAPNSPSAGAAATGTSPTPAELELKAQRVRDALERIGGFANLPLRPILGAAGRDGYRNKGPAPPWGPGKTASSPWAFTRSTPTALWTVPAAASSPRNSPPPWRPSGPGAAGTASPSTTRPPTRGCCGGCTCARPSPPGRSWPALVANGERPPLRDRAGGGPAGRGAGACQRGAQRQPGQDQRGLWGRSAAPCGGRTPSWTISAA